MIPKIIVQTSKTKLEKYVVDSLLLMAPGWEYIHFTDEEIIQFFNENKIDEFENIVEKFHSMPSGPHKADLFRYYFIYLKGGVFIDSDAMLEMDLNKIAKNYSFFSVNSSVFYGTIFQGFMGATSKNEIIYKCLKDAYMINTNELADDYPLLCRNMYNIIYNNYFDFEIKIYHEGFYNDYAFKCYNDDNEIILLHYPRDKIIPNKIIS